MVNVLVATGQQLNLVTRALATSSGRITVSTADTVFVPSYLGDGLSEIAFRFGSLGSSDYIIVNGDVLSNGLMEIAATSGSGAPQSWQQSAGTIAQSSAFAFGGTFSMAISAGGVAYQDITANAGERFTIQGALQGDTVNSARAQLQNLLDLTYLTSSGGWQAAQAYFFTSAATSFATRSVIATVAAYATTMLYDTVPLRLTLNESASSATVYADWFSYFPSVSLATLHGFTNIDPSIAVKLISSASSGMGSATTESTLTAYRPSFFYAPAAPIDKQYLQVIFSGQNSTQSGAIYGGELVFCQPITMQRVYDPAKSMEFKATQSRSQTVFGSQRVIALSSQASRQVVLPYRFTTLAEYQDQRDNVLRRSNFGGWPLVVVPSSTDPEICILGLVEEHWVAIEGPKVNYWEGSKLTITERGFPTWLS